MKKVRIALLVALAMCQYPLSAHAKGKAKPAPAASDDSDDSDKSADKADDKGADKSDDDSSDDKGAGDKSGTGDDSGGADKEGDTSDDSAGGDEEDEGEKPAGGGDLEGICKVDPDACPKVDFDKEAARDIKEQVYAVQQVFALRVRRFELQPYWSLTLNDQFVSHDGPGVGLNYWITQVLAIGVNGTYYQPFNADSAFNFETRRSAHIAVPLTEYQWGGALNFTYVPVAGKFSGFSDFIFQYDAYVVGGVGAISTRPIPTVDPDNRSFAFQPKLAFDAGLGLRIFFNRWFAADLEVRDYIFSDKIESTAVSATNPTDQSTWYDKQSRLTNNVQAQLGLSVFIPFSFDYRLPEMTDQRQGHGVMGMTTKIVSRLKRTAFAGLAAGLALLAGTENAHAQEILLTGPLAGAPAVRKLKLYREHRFEIAPVASFTLLDEYQRQMFIGARLNYNIADWIAIGVWGASGAVKFTTQLAENIQTVNQERRAQVAASGPTKESVITATNLGPDFTKQLGTMDWVVAPQVTLVPFRGKIALFQSIFADSDLYLFGGAAFVGVNERADCTAGACSNTPNAFAMKSSVAIAPTFGLGFSFYVNKWNAFGFEWRGMPFARNTGGFDNHGGGPNGAFPDYQITSADKEFKFNQMLSVSYGFYFPTVPHVSE